MPAETHVMVYRIAVLFLFASFFGSRASAELQLPSLFSNSMVLQRDKPGESLGLGGQRQ